MKNFIRGLFPKKSSGRKIVFIANSLLPTLQINFLVPLKPRFQSREIDYRVVVEDRISKALGHLSSLPSQENLDLIIERLLGPNVEALVFCRYSGICTQELIKYAQLRKIPIIYHLDDDLLNLPKEIGEKKYLFHNQPERLAAVRNLLNQANVIYCANKRVAELVSSFTAADRIYVGEIACAGVPSGPPPRRANTVGYMGFDHTHDFAQVSEAIYETLVKFPDIKFEIFGPITLPKEFNVFGRRIVYLPVQRNYEKFMLELRKRQWAIGIAPLAASEFNQKKSVNKWVEYSVVGCATVATKGTIYDDCCKNGEGILVPNEKTEWFEAIKALMSNNELRSRTVSLAQKRLIKDFHPQKLVKQFSDVIDMAGLARLKD